MSDKLSNIKELEPLLIGGKYITNLEKDIIRDYIEKKLNYIEKLKFIISFKIDQCNKLEKEIERLNKEKDDLDDCNRHLYNENKKLNNIINELEKGLNSFDIKGLIETNHREVVIVIDALKERLKELKEGK